MDIGVVIKKYRKEAGMTQEEMANRLGVTTPAVNKWENSNSKPKKLKRKSMNTANSRSCAGHCSLTLINSPTVKPRNYNLFCKIITTLLFVMP